ncbi:MAG: RsmD family RNA methyltransferase [Solirubrobacterales bacterium]
MRVVAGELGGQRILAPRGADVRPTSDRAREALFSILGDVSAKDVLDLFCGTGALGIEALSRGAESAVFVDTDVSPVEANIAALGLGDSATTACLDATVYLAAPGPEFDLVLCDPPYTLAARLASDLEQLVPSRLREGGLLVVESSSRSPLDLGLTLVRDRTYGEASLRIWSVA